MFGHIHIMEWIKTTFPSFKIHTHNCIFSRCATNSQLESIKWLRLNYPNQGEDCSHCILNYAKAYKRLNKHVIAYLSENPKELCSQHKHYYEYDSNLDKQYDPDFDLDQNNNN
jgi:hypothetical protein